MGKKAVPILMCLYVLYLLKINAGDEFEWSFS